MDATRLNYNSPRSFRVNEWLIYAEWSIYALLAAILIGQIFYIDSVVTMREVGMAMAGIIFGLMVSFAAVPVTTLIQRLRDTRGKLETQTTNMPFILRRSANDETQEDNNRRAA